MSCLDTVAMGLRREQLIKGPSVISNVTATHYAFVTTRLDYCNSVLAGAPRSATDKLQR